MSKFRIVYNSWLTKTEFEHPTLGEIVQSVKISSISSFNAKKDNGKYLITLLTDGNWSTYFRYDEQEKSVFESDLKSLENLLYQQK